MAAERSSVSTAPACEVTRATDDRWLAGTLRLDGRGRRQARLYAERPTRESWSQVKDEHAATRDLREQARQALRNT